MSVTTTLFNLLTEIHAPLSGLFYAWRKVMADEIITREQLIDASKDAESLQKFISGTDIEDVLTRLGQIYPTLAKLVRILMETGGWKSYQTEAILLATVPTVNPSVGYAFDTKKLYLWNGTQWTDEGRSPLDLAKDYTDEKGLVVSSEVSRLNVSIHQIASSMVDLINEYEIKFKESNSQDVNLLLGLQQLAVAISANCDDLDSAIATITQNKTHITHLNLGLQKVVDSICTLAEDAITPEPQKLQYLLILQDLVMQLSKLDGFDPDDIQASSGLASETAIDEDEPLYTFAEPKDIIRIDLTSDYEIPGAKGVVRNGNSKISIDGKVIKLPCTFEVQGSSSASFPKKNLTLGFFATETRDTAVKIKLGNLMPFDELIYKACWTDTAFCRLAMNYNIYGDMVQSRAGWPKRDVDHVYLGKTGYDSILTGANGHPVMWPCVVYFNGEFYGIGHFGSGKKRQNYNLEKDNPVQIQIDTAGWVNYEDLPTYLEANTGDLKAPKTFTSETKAAIQNFATAATSDLDTLRSLIDVNFNKINLIDYILFSMFIANRDTLNGTQVKNAQPVTWDGMKWYIMPYDLDYAQELHFTGAQLVPSVDYNIMTGFLGRVYTIWKDDIDARYAELRQAGVFTVENVYKHLNNIMSAFSEILMKQEFDRWPDRPSIDLTNMEQVLTFTQARIQWLDNLYSYTGV
ncbi:hypothetical protein EA756_08500 [Acinetobacter lactucae]|uniref:Spore coat protein CotH n=2 Tax=Acinetobacter lactucae TaxID=1785128 RepID=A0A429K0K9_9GAMM|nr:hypothetical protein EA756_08500 [Acinetobacter lactucae]